MNKIAVIGLSHLGLTTSLGLASLGKNILGLDSDHKIVNQLNKQVLSVYEPGFEDILQKHKTQLEFSSDFSLLKSLKLVFFCQDTATNGSGSVERLEELVSHALPFFSQGSTLVFMSQVPVGFYRNLQDKIKKQRPGFIFHLYHMVDTIIMTEALNRFINPERIIIGAENSSQPFTKTLQSFLDLFSCQIFKMSYESAELTKAAINLYLANTVTFANTLSDYCEAVGANIQEIIPALKTDKRIGPFAYLRPTLRIAGGHLERDLLMLNRLAKRSKIHSGVVSSILKGNRHRFKWVEEKLKLHLLPKVSKPTICIWGLAYKKNTNSTNNAPSLKIIKDLSHYAKLQLYDPLALLPKKFQQFQRFPEKYQALEKADCLVILTEWDEFTQADLSLVINRLDNHLIIDSVGILKDQKEKLADCTYIMMGAGESRA